MRPIVHLNSSSDHGGSIITAGTTTFYEGIGVACRDDGHECPIPEHGKTKIVTFDPKVFADGRGVARVGDKAECRAVIAAGCAKVFGGG